MQGGRQQDQQGDFEAHDWRSIAAQWGVGKFNAVCGWVPST
jgi:hypothetical protein